MSHAEKAGLSERSFIEATDACRPVFVVGMNGSGTTVLLDCLGRHPLLYAFPHETRLIPWLMAKLPSYGNLADDANFRRLWDDVQRLPVFCLANGGEPLPLPEDWQQHERSLAAVLDVAYRFFARQQAKRRWCEKTPQHVQHLEALARLFPDAKFIHVVRDGRDCAASFHRRWKRQPELTVFRWKKVVMAGHRQGSRLGPERYLEVRYEDLTAEPEPWLRKICDFLDLAFAAPMLESAQPYFQSDASGPRSGLRRNSGKWQQYFQSVMLDRLEAIAGATLAQFGYQTQRADADQDLSALQRRYWTVMEVVRQYSAEIMQKLRGEIERPWRVILLKPVTALRQRRHNDY